MDIFIKLFFSLIAVAVPAFFWWITYREMHWESLQAVVKHVEILRPFFNPAWRITIAYEFEGKAYLCDISLAERDWLGGVVENQKIMVRVNTNSPQKCFIECGGTKPFSGFMRNFALGFSACVLIIIWA